MAGGRSRDFGLASSGEKQKSADPFQPADPGFLPSFEPLVKFFTKRTCNAGHETTMFSPITFPPHADR
jgi:hypothetical protein